MSGIWPGDTRCVVMLGFDIDGVSGAINRDPGSANLPSLMSAREYGPSVAAPRILDLLERYGLPAEFLYTRLRGGDASGPGERHSRAGA